MAKLFRILQDRMRMLREDAAAVASVVEGAFHGKNEVDDAQLHREMRQVFYDLQDEHVLGVRREERDVDGRLERHYVWHVADHALRGETPPPMAEDERLYKRLPHRAWERRRIDGTRDGL